jgi:hypothetical protein
MGFRYHRRSMQRRMLVCSAAAMAVVFYFVAAGCGESSAKKRKDLLCQGNKIIAHFEGLQNAVIVPTLNPISAKATHLQRAQWGVAIKQLAYLGAQEVKTLGKLKAPKGLSDDFQALLTTRGGAFASMTQGARAAEQNHVSEISAPIKAARDGLAEATKQAKALGLRECE